MLDGIEQPGDRRLLADIEATPQSHADIWRDGFDTGREAGLKSGYIDAMMEAARLLIEAGAGVRDEGIRNAYAHVIDVLLGKAKDVIRAVQVENAVEEGEAKSETVADTNPNA